MTQSIQSQLADLLSPGAIIAPERLKDYAFDGLVPRAVARPADRQMVSEIMKWASSQGVSVFPRGGGTQMDLGNVPTKPGLVLDVGQQSRILDYQPADLTATVEAGVPLDQLQRELAAGGKFLPIEAPIAERATIGGILASGTTGPLRFSYGQPRDWLIGISVVGADGVETKAGGKVVKNVTGYDLDKLYTGSLGTLGIIVEATFKLSPYPTERSALVAGFSTLPDGIAAGRDLLRQVFAPQGVQVIDGQVARHFNAGSDSALGDQFEENQALAIAFFAGRRRGVERRMADCARLLREAGASHINRLDEAESQPLLKGLTDVGWSSDTKPHLGIKVNVPPSALGQLVSQYREKSPLGFPPGMLADPGFGMVRLYWWSGSISDWIDDSALLDVITGTRALAREAGGWAVVEYCPLPLKAQIDVWGELPSGIEIMRQIKDKFDPLGILSPGRYVGRL